MIEKIKEEYRSGPEGQYDVYDYEFEDISKKINEIIDLLNKREKDSIVSSPINPDIPSKKTLSDKRLPNKFCDEKCSIVGEYKYIEQDVKESLKEIIRRVSGEHNEELDEHIMPKRVIQIIREEAGERLI